MPSFTVSLPKYWLLLLFLSFQTFARVKLEGSITDNTTHKPVAGATIILDGLKIGTTSDSLGHYLLAVPIGELTVRVTAVGYYNKVRIIQVNDDLKLDFDLLPKLQELDEIVVKGKTPDANVKSIEMSTIRLDIKNIKKIPVVFGEVDIIKALLLQAGVSTVGEGAGGFNVRGGRTDQNLVLLDEAPIFNTSHLLGFFASINPDVLQDVTLMKGGIPADYGGRLSSLVKMNTKTGNDESIRVSGGIGNISGRLLAEGPLNDNLTFLVAGRMAYPNWIIKQFPSDFGKSRAFFYDFNGKLTYKINKKNTIAASFYRSYDTFKFASDTAYSWISTLGSLRYNSLLTDKLSLNVTTLLSDYQFQMDGMLPFNGFTFTSGIRQQENKIGLVYDTQKAYKWEIGGGLIYYTSHLGNRLPSDASSNINPKSLAPENAREWNVYASEEWKISSAITLQAGLRYSSYDLMGEKTVYSYRPNESLSEATIIGQKKFSVGESVQTYGGFEPRISLNIGISPTTSLKMSYNKLNQYLHLISNTTAISPVDFWKLSDSYLHPQSGQQVAIGVFKNFKENTFETSIEGYYKKISSMLEYKNGAVLLLNPYLETDIVNAIGKAYGVEMSLAKNKGMLTGQINYTYARSLVATHSIYPLDNVNGGAWFPSNFDKPHTINASISYNLGKNWSYSTNFTYSTGRPTTYPDGIYAYENVPIINYSLRNTDRIPDYHRLDMSISKDTRKVKGQKHYYLWVFSLYNVYARLNPYSIYFLRNNRTTSAYELSVFGSIIPSLTWNFNF